LYSSKLQRTDQQPLVTRPPLDRRARTRDHGRVRILTFDRTTQKVAGSAQLAGWSPAKGVVVQDPQKEEQQQEKPIGMSVYWVRLDGPEKSCSCSWPGIPITHTPANVLLVDRWEMMKYTLNVTHSRPDALVICANRKTKKVCCIVVISVTIMMAPRKPILNTITEMQVRSS
jgi:hypothetical protein